MLNSTIYRKSQRQSSRVICKPKIDFSFLQPTASSRIIFFFLIPRCELDRLFVGNPTLLGLPPLFSPPPHFEATYPAVQRPPVLFYRHSKGAVFPVTPDLPTSRARGFSARLARHVARSSALRFSRSLLLLNLR